MESATRLLGVLIVLDLVAAFLLVLLTWFMHRRNPNREKKRFAWSQFLGALSFLGLCTLLIYGGFWMVLRSR